MTYDITIGNAIFGEATGLFFDPTGFQQVFSVVEEIELEEAPYSNRLRLAKANHCTVSYAYWRRFTKKVGLNDLFWNRDKGLMKHHPGLEPIRPADLAQVQEALVKYRWAGLAAVPGRKDDWVEGRYNMLESLTWLEWWMNWALENCQWPAIHNE